MHVIRDVLDKKSKWHTMQNGYQGQTSLNEWFSRKQFDIKITLSDGKLCCHDKNKVFIECNCAGRNEKCATSQCQLMFSKQLLCNF